MLKAKSAGRSRCVAALLMIRLFAGADGCLARPAPQLRIFSFNILAACWASPSLYPQASQALLAREHRRKATLTVLLKHAPKVDVFALQETTQTEFEYFQAALASQFIGRQAFHAPGYWADWQPGDTIAEPHGVAIFVRRARFKDLRFYDTALSHTGNHAALFRGTHRTSGLPVQIASVHLDADEQANRSAELGSLLEIFKRQQTNVLSLIAGDFNIDTAMPPLDQQLRAAGFVNILYQLGIESWTSPYRDGFYASRENGIIDHLLVSGATPLSGEVIDFGLWDAYPSAEGERVNANLEASGSDHFPLWGAVTL